MHHHHTMLIHIKILIVFVVQYINIRNYIYNLY